MSIADSRDDATSTTVKQHSGRIGMTGKLLLAVAGGIVAGGIVGGGVVAYKHFTAEQATPLAPSPLPPPLQPGAVTESVSAKELTLVLKVEGTIEEYAAVADSVEANLRQELQCFLPACLLTVTATAGSVILTVVVTDTTAGGASEVESAAVALQTKPLDAMSSVLGVTIEEAPATPSVTDVQAQVMRLAPSPPPPSPPPPSLPPSPPPPPSSPPRLPLEAYVLTAVGGSLLAACCAGGACMLMRRRRRRRQRRKVADATIGIA